MILIINILTYLIGLSWVAFGVLGIIDPEIFTESAWAALHVQITGQFGTVSYTHLTLPTILRV